MLLTEMLYFLATRTIDSSLVYSTILFLADSVRMLYLPLSTSFGGPFFRYLVFLIGLNVSDTDSASGAENYDSSHI